MSESYMLRLPDGMRDRIRQRAAANRRSMNLEIVHYLDRALAAEEARGPAEVAASPSHGSSHPQQENVDERAEA